MLTTQTAFSPLIQRVLFTELQFKMILVHSLVVLRIKHPLLLFFPWPNKTKYTQPQDVSIKLPPAVPVTRLPLSPRETRGQSPRRGAWGEGCPRRRPPTSPLPHLVASGKLGRRRDRASYLVQHTWFLWLGERWCCVALGFREVSFAPPQVTAFASSWQGRRLPQLHLVPAGALGYSHSPSGRAQTPAAAASALTSWRGLGKRMPEAACRHLGKGGWRRPGCAATILAKILFRGNRSRLSSVLRVVAALCIVQHERRELGF